MNRDPSMAKIADDLAAPFDPKEVKFKSQAVKGNRALAVAFIDARLIQDRLDSVLGCENWQDSYKLLSDGSVMCRLACRIGGTWVRKMDVGSPSEQPDIGDRLKAAFSDALKRAAVKFGIGRYLYRLPAQWVDYDPVKKQIVSPPQLPAFAIPRKPVAKPEQQPSQKPAAEPAQSPANTAPKDGCELAVRLARFDKQITAEGRCNLSDLIGHVVRLGVERGFPSALADWNSTDQINYAVEVAREFDRTHPAKKKPETSATAKPAVKSEPAVV